VRGPDTVVEDIRENRPTVVGCPPRLLERLHDTARRDVEAGGWLRSKVFQRALDLGETVACYRLEERPLPPLLKARLAVAERLWFSQVREHLGGNVRMVMSGAAPARREVVDFFHAVGAPVYETYGLTESGGLVTANVPGATRIGTVGRPLPGYQVRVGEGGEVLVRGGGVFVGYLGADGEPAALDGLDSEGWLQTGDVGRLDRDGYLTITERKSDIIVTSTGKNVAPQNIEGLIRRNRAVGHVVVVGDRRPYLSALVTLEPDEAPFLARTLGIPFRGLDQLSREPAVLDFVRGQIDRANEELSRVEQVRRFTVLPDHLSVERGLVTPTLELRRQQILEDYADEIESMYQ
jgi:long-chain acyl-CoA synthetase